MTRTCMKALERNIWRSSISLQTKIRLYQTVGIGQGGVARKLGR